MNVKMKYSEFMSEVMKEIENDITKNNKLFKDGCSKAREYNLKLMKQESTSSMAFDIKSEDSFTQVINTVEEVKEKLQEYQVTKVSDCLLETEDEWAGFYYYVYFYEPIDTFNDISQWEQKEIIKQTMAVKLGFNSSRFLKCEIMNLYKEDIINLEQVIEAHTKGC